MPFNSSTLNFCVLEDGTVNTQKAILGEKVSHDGTYFFHCADQLLENEKKWETFNEKRNFIKELIGFKVFYASMKGDYSKQEVQASSPRYEYIPAYSPLGDLGGHYPYLFSNIETADKIVCNNFAFYAGELARGFSGSFNGWNYNGEMWNSTKYGFDYIQQESKEEIINTSDEFDGILSMKLISVRQLPDIDINGPVNEEEVKQEMLSEAERYYRVNITNSSYQPRNLGANFIDFGQARDYPTIVVIASEESDLKFNFKSGLPEHWARNYVIKRYTKELNEKICYYYRIDLFHGVRNFTYNGDQYQELRPDVEFSFCSNSHQKIPFTIYVEGVELTKKKNWTYTLNNLSWNKKGYFSSDTNPIINYEGKATLQYSVWDNESTISKPVTITKEIDIIMKTDSSAIYPTNDYKHESSRDGKYTIILPTMQI